MKASYRQLFLQAFRITWRNKYLWIFGVFASLFSSLEIIKFIDAEKTREQLISNLSYLKGLLNFDKLKEVAINAPVEFSILIFGSLILLAIGAIYIWLSITSQASIIISIQRINSKRKLNYSQMLAAGRSKFWSVLGLNLTGKIFILIVGILILIPGILGLPAILSNSLLIIFQILFIIIAVSAYFVFLYAINFHVLENENFKNSIIKGITLYKKNWLISLEITFIIILIILLTSYISLHVANIVIVFISIIGGAITSVIGLLVAVIFLVVLILALGMLIGAITMLQLSIWTLLFEQLRKEEQTSKIVQAFKYLKSKINN